MTQKNKIFSITLSLLILGSVACRKSGGGNGGGVVTEPDALPGTFSITEASGNVKALVVKPETTVSDIKIDFSSSADYTADFTVEYTAETVEANRITSEDFEFTNNSLTAKATLVNKVRELDSSSQAVEKTIKINFTFKAKDTTLKNNIKTLSIEVKLTKELAFKLSSLVGKWTEADKKTTFTISEKGELSGSIDNSSIKFNIDSWDNTKEVPQLTATHKNSSQTTGDTVFTFIFENANSCKVSVKGQAGTTSKSFTKDTTAK